MKLKEYIVVKTPTGRIDLWMTEMFEEVKRNNPPDYDNYRIITTFDPGEELKEGGGMKTKEEILERLQKENPHSIPVFKAMDEYAAQFAGTREDWISVEESMPEHNTGVLVFIPAEDDHITSGMWDISDEWVLLDEYRSPKGEVTHWRKLPNPPNTNILKPI